MSSSQVLVQMFPGQPTWSVNNIPDLTGKVTIVTGGNVGVGKETVKALLNKNAKVYLAARSRERAEAAISDLEKETGRRAVWLELDLSDLSSVRKSAQSFLSSETELHILFNNAGVMTPPVEQVTKDGFDLQFGTNVIGHYLFTKLVTPTLRAAAKNGGHARVVHTSSSGAYMGAIDFDTFVDGPKRKKLGTQALYNQSKLGNVLIAREFAKRHAADGILHASLNPGNLKTELGRHMSFIKYTLVQPLLFPAPYGALTQLFVGTMDLKANGIESGKFYIPWAREGPMPNGALDDQVAEKLYKWLDDVTTEKAGSQ